MTWILARPSFWPEPRDPWAWQRALVLLASAAPVPDPRPCWKEILREEISRRSVQGLYGLPHPSPAKVLGLGLLRHTEIGWVPTPVAEMLMMLDRQAFQDRLAELIVRRSAWLRLSLIELSAGRWTLPRGAAPLRALRQMRVDEDLLVPEDALARLPAPEILLGDLHTPEIHALETRVSVDALSALHAPLYLLHARGWLSDTGVPELPDALASTLRPESPAVALRRITAEEQDAAGFVPIAKAAKQLYVSIHGAGGPKDLAAWVDTTIGGAIDGGAIEVHDWAPGQPRHGRGLYGDRARKLARWTIHDDLELRTTQAGKHREGDR